jgi:hypothetical protein
MTSEISASEGRRHRLWTEGEVLKLLCSLNNNIVQIRKEVEGDRSVGIDIAADLLSEKVGNGCTPARAKSKIADLWKWYRPYNGTNDANQPYPVYIYGAWTRTLPGLGQQYPSMLQDIASDGEAQQR